MRRTPASALDAYIGEMERWVETAKTGKAVTGLIPVETSGGEARLEPSPEIAADLEKRLRFLDEQILANHADDLAAGGASAR